MHRTTAPPPQKWGHVQQFWANNQKRKSAFSAQSLNPEGPEPPSQNQDKEHCSIQSFHTERIVLQLSVTLNSLRLFRCRRLYRNDTPLGQPSLSWCQRWDFTKQSPASLLSHVFTFCMLKLKFYFRSGFRHEEHTDIVNFRGSFLTREELWGWELSSPAAIELSFGKKDLLGWDCVAAHLPDRFMQQE